MAHDPRDAARERWRTARTFAQLCTLGADFVSGESPVFPGWMADAVDAETDPYVPLLVAANRAGFLTCASQPGLGPVPDHDGLAKRQRAFVCGFAERPLAARLEGLHGQGGLWVAGYETREGDGPRLALGLRGATPYLHGGYGAGPEELPLFDDALDRRALDALARTRWVWLIDLAWGRDDVLWDALRGRVASE